MNINFPTNATPTQLVTLRVLFTIKNLIAEGEVAFHNDILKAMANTATKHSLLGSDCYRLLAIMEKSGLLIKGEGRNPLDGKTDHSYTMSLKASQYYNRFSI